MTRKRTTRLGPTSTADPLANTRYLFWWLLLAIFFEYARPGAFVSGINALRLNSLIPLALVVACVFAQGLRPLQEIARDATTKWLLAYFGLITLSVLHAEVTLYAFDVFKSVLGYVLLAFVIVRICTTPERIRGVFAILIVAHLFLLAMNPAAVLNPHERNYIQGGTFLGDGNDFSLSICIVVPMAIELALSSTSRIRQVLCWVALLVLILAVIGTQSRGGTLGLLAAGSYLLLRSPRKGLTLGLVILVVVAALAYAPDEYFNRMRTISAYEEDGSAMGRITAWKAAIQMCLDHPLLGVGAGMFPVSFGTYYRPAEHMPWLTAHSMYFLVLGELALPGIIALLGLTFGNLLANRRAARSLDSVDAESKKRHFPKGPARLLYMLSASMVGFVLSGAFLSVAYYPHLFVLSGLMVSARCVAAVAPGPSVTRAETPSRSSGPRMRLSHLGTNRRSKALRPELDRGA